MEKSDPDESVDESSASSCDCLDWDAFYREHYREMVAFVIFLGGSEPEAEDATQNAMIDLFGSWDRVANRPSWTKKAAQRYFVKAQRRERHGSRLLESTIGSPSQQATLDVQIEAIEIAAVIEELRLRLPPKQAEILMLAIKGFEPHEISEILATAPSTTRSNLRFARNNARQILRQALPVDDEPNLLREGE